MADVSAGFTRTDDGLQLYYRTVGSGPPLVCCNGVGVSTFFWKYVAEHYRDRFTVILWDYRAHGLSGTPRDLAQADLSIERNARDLHTVLRAIGVTEPAVLLGHSMGCQVILEFTRRYPEQVAALVPMFGTYGKPLDTFMDSPHARPVIETFARLARRGGRRAARALLPLYASPLAFDLGRLTRLIDPYYARRQDIEAYMEHLAYMNPQAFFRMVELMAEHDLEAFLPHIRIPVLVVAGEKDLFTPLHRSQRMANLIPGAELLVLAEGSHAAIVEHPETINRRVDRFLAERLPTAVSAGARQAS
jgi:pimeloyl-ACP methyl ester carboxylesterase